ncbi:metallophosphoesterase [Alkalibacterium iburiense]|uniref:Metallophosphoesterase n=1 Tax=Alkalibacterium iburiense TaxID=290589 RepID=A0ABN0X161_9LACT
MKISKKLSLLLILTLLFGFAFYGYYQNNSIEVSYYSINDERIPETFHDYTIVQVSDLHTKDFKGDLHDKISDQDPDIILITGDLIDRNRTDLDFAVQAVEEMIDIAPVYYVSGNHEIASGEYEDLSQELDSIGVRNLDNDFDSLEKEGETIGLVGLEDPLLLTQDEIEETGTAEKVIEETLATLIEESGTDYTILLSHRAELMDIYASTSIDIAFTGHAHGGQIRLPFIEGLYSPSQGFFPKYTSGLYEENGTQMIVSRGLGNSIFPVRINNRPDLVVLTLKTNGIE